jgi:hypothetical protein
MPIVAQQGRSRNARGDLGLTPFEHTTHAGSPDPICRLGGLVCPRWWQPAALALAWTPQLHWLMSLLESR